MKISLADLAARLNAEVKGDPECEITGVATLANAAPGDISFLSNPRYRKHLADTKASAVIVHPDDQALCKVNALVTPEVYLAYAAVARMLDTAPPPSRTVHPSAVIGVQCQIAKTATIEAHCVIGDGVVLEEDVWLGPGCVVQAGSRLGAGTRLVANVVVMHDILIGERVIIHPGAVIGSDGFGIANDNGVWRKIPQLGRVVIGNDVEIGANTTIDRGAIDDTVIEEGAKLDNQIQVGHNVRIGKHTAIAGCTGIAGSVTIGDHCAFGGACMISGHLEITSHVQLTVGSMVTKSIKQPGLYSSGFSVQENRTWNRNVARFKKIDQLAREVHRLKKSGEQ